MGIRMRRKSGWPAKVMPKRSYTSRSYQFADGQTPTTVGTGGTGMNRPLHPVHQRAPSSGAQTDTELTAGDRRRHSEVRVQTNPRLLLSKGRCTLDSCGDSCKWLPGVPV